MVITIFNLIITTIINVYTDCKYISEIYAMASTMYLSSLCAFS